MEKFKEFRKVNGITQAQLAEYLQVSKPFISLVENNKSILPKDKLQMLLNNTNGWDTSMLQDGMTMSASAHGIANTASINIGGNEEAYKIKIEHLESLLKQSEARCEQYWNMIQDLIKKLGHE